MLYLAEKHVETNIASAAIRLLPQNATNSVFFQFATYKLHSRPENESCRHSLQENYLTICCELLSNSLSLTR